MHPRVRQLYKELIFTAQNQPGMSMTVARERIQDRFMRNRSLEVGSPEWKRALAWGRMELRNLRDLQSLARYRFHNEKYTTQRTVREMEDAAREARYADKGHPH